VQAHADVTLPIGDGRARPISNFFASVAATGERKSECDQQAAWPIRKHEKTLRGKYEVDLPAYINDKAMNEGNKLKTAAGLSCAWDGEPTQASFRADASRRT
jgi:hypothetical protein